MNCWGVGGFVVQLAYVAYAPSGKDSVTADTLLLLNCLSLALIDYLCHRNNIFCDRRLSVCEPNYLKKLWVDFHEILGIGRIRTREELIKFWNESLGLALVLELGEGKCTC